MERVNLLPDEARMSLGERLLHQIDQNFPKVLAGIFGAVAAVGLVVSAGQAMSVAGGKKRVKALKQEIKLLEVEAKNSEAFSKQLEQVEQELTRQKKTIEEKLTYLKAVKERPRLWAAVLKELRRNIPHGMWLIEMETGAGNALRVAGGATDENLVTQFMSNLKESPHFSNVGFTYTEKDAIGSVAIVKFEIVCRVS